MTRKPGRHLEFECFERGLFSKSEAKAALSGETYPLHLAFLMENERGDDFSFCTNTLLFCVLIP